MASPFLFLTFAFDLVSPSSLFVRLCYDFIKSHSNQMLSVVESTSTFHTRPFLSQLSWFNELNCYLPLFSTSPLSSDLSSSSSSTVLVLSRAGGAALLSLVAAGGRHPDLPAMHPAAADSVPVAAVAEVELELAMADGDNIRARAEGQHC